MKLRHDMRPNNPLQRRPRSEFLMVLPLPFAARLNAALGELDTNLYICVNNRMQ
jgi:hypothetical protein